MAAAKRLSRQTNDITECPICVKTFTNPKVLPCMHTFCLKCLLKYGEHDKRGNQVACPLCRTNFVIPPGGIADLPNNLFVNRLLLVNQLTSASGSDVTQKCDVCIEDEIDASAAGYCIECLQHLCGNCKRCHKKLRSTKLHHVVNLEDKPSSVLLLKMTPSYCAQHPDEQIKLYCYDCKMVTCVVCHVTEHSKHECSDIKKSAEEFRKHLDDDIEKVTSCAQQSQDKLLQLKRDSEGLLENLRGTQQAVSAAYDKLKSLLDFYRDQLLKQLNTIWVKCSKKIECKRDELMQQCHIVESFKTYCEEMKEKGTACDISRAANDLHMRSAELVKAHEQYNRQQLDRVELSFTPSSTVLTSGANPIGTIYFRKVTKTITKIKVLRIIERAEGVRGMAQLGTELYVCLDFSERVAVYDVNTCRETRYVIVEGMKQPRSIAACQQDNCLYISDDELKSIHRVDLSNTSCSKWSLNAEPRGVSLTRAFNLLVTLPQSIEEFATTGNLIRSIRLDKSLDNPQHSIELSSGQFVVCHAGSTHHRVCVVDTAGRIVQSYGGSPCSPTGQLNTPCCLAVDARGYVFVADHYNNKVQVLSPTLTHIGDVSHVTMPKNQLYRPEAVLLDELNCHLFAGARVFDKRRKLKVNTRSRASRAELLFPVGRIHAKLRKSKQAERVDISASIFLAGTMEYLAADLLALGSNAAHAMKQTRICPLHLKMAIIKDEEFNELLTRMKVHPALY